MTLSPLIVTAPVERSGTTLVQRLICSSNNGICYGENLFVEVLDMLAYATAKIQYHAADRASEEKGLQSVLEGKADRWIPNLSPAHDDYLYAIISIFYVLPRFADQYSNSIGRPIWGMKRPSLSYGAVVQLLSLLPKAKVLYVYRDIFACVRSAKARKFIENEDGVAKMAEDWSHNLSAAIDKPDNGGLHLIRYEDLVAAPGREIARLERATGVRGIDPQVMNVKVNTWEGEGADGHAQDQYVFPADLSGGEREIIRRIAGDLVDRLFP